MIGEMFVVRLDGEPIFSTDEQVIGCRLMTSRGEAAAIGLSQTDGVVDIVLDRVHPGGPVRLDQLEAQANLDIRERGKEGQTVGANPTLLNTVPAANQGAVTSTLTKGDTPDSGIDPRAFINQNPSVDLATGLQLTDSATLTNRINAFGDHGDAQKAVDDHPANSGDSTSSPSDGASIDASSRNTTGQSQMPPAGELGIGAPSGEASKQGGADGPFAPGSSAAFPGGTPDVGASGPDIPSDVPSSAQAASPVDASSTAGTLGSPALNTEPPPFIGVAGDVGSDVPTPPIGTVVESTSSATPDIVTGKDASVASAAPTLDKVETITEFAREPDGTIGVIQADGIHIKIKP